MKTKKALNMLLNSGVELADGALYWINGDARLKASQRQCLSRIVKWIANLPKILKDEFKENDQLVVASSFSERNREQIFEIYGYYNNPYRDVFSIKVFVNDLDWWGEDHYLEHWEGFKIFLKNIDYKNMNQYLDERYSHIEVSRDKEGDIVVSHMDSFYGIQPIVDVIESKDFDPKKMWLFQDYRYNHGYIRLEGVFVTPSFTKVFWRRHWSDRLICLEYSLNDSGKVIKYSWDNDSYMNRSMEFVDKLWIHKEVNDKWEPYIEAFSNGVYRKVYP